MPGTPYAIGSAANTSSGDVVISVGHAVAIGDLIFVGMGASGGGQTITDSQGNSYTPNDGNGGSFGGLTQSAWYCFATAALTTSDTITISNSALYCAANAAGVSGLNAVDVQRVGGSSSGSTNAYSVAPANDGEIAFLFFGSRVPFTPPPPGLTTNPTTYGGGTQPATWGTPLGSTIANDLETWLYAGAVNDAGTYGDTTALATFTGATSSIMNIATFYGATQFTPGAGSISFEGVSTPFLSQIFTPGAGHVAFSGGAPTMFQGTPPYDPTVTVISQYANSPVILALIEAFAAAEDPSQAINQFYDLLWNVLTAQGYGLDVWGRIVGVGRVIQIPSGTFFSFENAGNPGVDNFGGGPFYSGNDFTSNFSLTDPAFLQLILAKAAANICDGSIPAINEILMALFPGLGNCYVTDSEDMTMTYTFGAPLSPVDYAIITQTGVLPKPVGVAASVVEL